MTQLELPGMETPRETIAGVRAKFSELIAEAHEALDGILAGVDAGLDFLDKAAMDCID